MSTLVEALQPSLVRGIFATEGPYLSQSLSDLITSRHSAFNVAFDEPNRSFALEFPDYEYVTHSIASDCRRLATSSWQTAYQVWSVLDDKAGIPWALIRLYYASFYASHVLIRLLGEACCWLEPSHLKRVAAVAQAVASTAPPFHLEAGAYRCSVDASGKVLRWTRASSGSKGAHEALWSVLDLTLRNLDAKVLAGALPIQSAQAVVAKLEEFRQLSVTNGSSSWLSRTRNEVQYRFEHGVWHASSLTKQQRDQLRRIAEQWLVDPMTIDLAGVRSQDKLCQFASACAFILSACRVLLLRIDEGSSKRNASFVRHGPRAFANFTKMDLVTSLGGKL